MKAEFLKKATVVGITALLASQIYLPNANASWGYQKLQNTTVINQQTYPSTTTTNTTPNTTYSNTGYTSSRDLAYQRLLQSRQGTSTTVTPTTPTTNPSAPITQPAPTPPAPTPSTNVPTPVINKEAQVMLDLVNGERAKNGLKPLAWHVKLGELAVMKSDDIAKNDYFSHTSPTYGSFYSMVHNAGISYRQVGENLAMAKDVNKAFVLLMASEGHRKNMLSSTFTHIGIGVVPDQYGVVVTQLFITQ